MIVLGLLLLLVVVLIVARRRRKSALAGLDSSRPVFSVEPPRRSVGRRKHEAL